MTVWLFEREALTNIWTEYMGELYADDRVTRPAINDESGPPITWTEAKHAINKIKNNKATGTDLVEAKLTELCNEIYNTGYWPKDQLSQETKSNKIPRIHGNWRNESSHLESYDGSHEMENRSRT